MARYRRGWSRGWRKSPRGQAGEWFDSGWELQYMDELDRDPLVAKWTHHHGVEIPYTKWWGASGRYQPDFFVELLDGSKELREVKGEHLFQDANTTRKLQAGEIYCRNHRMKYRVITKSGVNPEMWSPTSKVITEELPPIERPPLGENAFENDTPTARDPSTQQTKAGCLVTLEITIVLITSLIIWLIIIYG